MPSDQLDKILAENKIRRDKLNTPYNPATGLGSPLKRIKVDFSHADVNYSIYFPKQMFDDLPILQKIRDEGSVEKAVGTNDFLTTQAIINDLSKKRFDYDFEFWAFVCAKIQDKVTKQEIPFILNRAQRKLLSRLEKMRTEGVPIRIVLLKARQWGGSTLVQIYMAWIQRVLKTNWHSAIIADVDDQARNIRGMYRRLGRLYPQQFGTITFVPYEGSSKTKMIKERNCIVGVGSAQKPESLASYDFAMLHVSELGKFKSTPQRSTEDLLQNLRSTVPNAPDSIIVLESTAKGVGNAFHREWQAAKKGESSYDPVFVAWFEIERYQKTIKENDLPKFIEWMLAETTGYAKYLWSIGATLEGIKWYFDTKIGENYDTWRMNEDFPSNDKEAFASTGRRVFSPEYVLNMRNGCVKPVYVGELKGDAQVGPDSLKNIKFLENPRGNLLIWSMPDITEDITDRYAIFGDVGGRTILADYSCLRVIDRYWMMDGGRPEIVATWWGHCFVPDTLIYTSDGFKQIKDVKVGDLVWTHKNRFKKVIKTYKNNYSGEVISIRSQGNYETVTCTPEHPFYSNNVVNKIERVPWRNRYQYNKKECIGDPKWIEANNLQYIAYSKNRVEFNPSFIINKYNGGKSKDTVREITDLKVFYSILGYYLAEGHINHKGKNKKPYGVYFSFSYYERETVAKDCYEKLLKLGFKSSIIEYKDVGVCRVRVCDTHLASLVLELCGEHSWEKKISSVVLESSKELLSELLESYWKGDGSTYNTDQTITHSASTVSPILARQIRDILILLGYRPGIYRVIAKTKNSYIKSKRPRYNIVWTVSEIKKYSLLQDANNIAYKVKTKTSQPYSGFVYNLEVEEDNSYSTACYVVHNCDQDIFAWISAQLGMFYGIALLAIETNSLRTKKSTEGDHFITILDEIAPYYTNMFSRTDPEKIRMKVPIKYGFHTNSGTKSLIINTLNAALRDNLYVEKWDKACDEMDTLEYKIDGTIGAVDGCHDDVAITTAGVVWMSLKYLPLPVVSKPFTTNKNIIISEASFG